MKDVVFVDDTKNNVSDLEMHPSGRNEDPIVVGIIKSFKSCSFDIEGCEEHVGDELVSFQEAKGGPTSKGCSLTLKPQDNCIH